MRARYCKLSWLCFQSSNSTALVLILWASVLHSWFYNWGTGRVVDAMGYTPVFVVAGVLGPLGLLATVLLAGRVAPIKASDLR